MNQVDSCYRALGVVHNLYKPVPQGLKIIFQFQKLMAPIAPYQSHNSGRRSLGFKSGQNKWLPSQITESQDIGYIKQAMLTRTQVKESPPVGARTIRASKESWQSLIIEHLKVDLFTDEVFVFTPNGEIMELPRGACAIDFAYGIHTDIGNSCVACRVDRSFAPLSMQLESGQNVEIISSDEARPNPDWLTFVVTSKARSAIRMALKNQQKTSRLP